MNEAPETRSTIPGWDELHDAVGQRCTLSHPGGFQTEATLARVRRGTPMGPRYECYSAEFKLQQPLPQDTYTLRSDHGTWQLLLTPVRPDDDGLPMLEAVMHVLRPEPPESVHADANPSPR